MSIRQTTLLLFLCATQTVVAQTIEVHKEFRKYFDECNVDGSFSLYDLRNRKYILYNPDQFSKQFTPASTFKICNSLIGLETGVIPDENYVMRWDSVKRRVPSWNADQDLKSAFKNSTVWYYQELARRVGVERMTRLLKKAGYGNTDTSGGIDQFWLNGGLRVSPEQQIKFLVQLHTNDLLFSGRTVEIVKRIMLEEKTSEYSLRTKTGWGDENDNNIGWYVGYVTKGKDVFFFATCIQTTRPDDAFPANRKRITRNILRDLNVLPQS